jgi:pimeloyl-ACP methyl ester carboxylesterase
MVQEIVTSTDGTPIAYQRSGEGPPLVLVHGTSADHTRWKPVLPAFEEHFNVYALDRRGRGSSGDSEDYSIDQEFEDVAAVVGSPGSLRTCWATPTGHCAPSGLLCSPPTAASWRSTSLR